MGEREHLTGTPAQNCRGQRRPRWPLNNKSGDWHNLDQLLKPLLPLLSRSISAQTDSMLLLLLVFLLLLTGVSACLVRHLFGRKELLQPRSSKAGRERERPLLNGLWLASLNFQIIFVFFVNWFLLFRINQLSMIPYWSSWEGKLFLIENPSTSQFYRFSSTESHAHRIFRWKQAAELLLRLAFRAAESGQRCYPLLRYLRRAGFFLWVHWYKILISLRVAAAATAPVLPRLGRVCEQEEEAREEESQGVCPSVGSSRQQRWKKEPETCRQKEEDKKVLKAKRTRLGDIEEWIYRDGTWRYVWGHSHLVIKKVLWFYVFE